MSQSVRAADRHPRWVAMWREAVRASREAMALVELSTARFIEISHRAATLFGMPFGASGLDYLSVAEHPVEAAETYRLLGEGRLDGVRARRWYQRPDGSRVHVDSSGWAIRSHFGPDLALWAAREVQSEPGRAQVGSDVLDVLSWRRVPANLDSLRVAIDDGWRMAQISSEADLLLGRTPAESVGSSIIELTHPDDLPVLLFAFARATTQSSVDVRVRLRHRDGSWRTVHAAPTAVTGEGEGTLPFALALGSEDRAEAPDPNAEASRLAGHLRRIAAQIETAGVPVETAQPVGVPLTTELTPREWEVALRLVRGERVATIAAGMYLSPSTVRNHLSAIFRKAGVHSQQEFLALWRRGTGGTSTLS